MEPIRLADVAAVLADPSRATMCLAMLDGRAWTVGELARTADIAPSTATEHVHILLDADFVETVRQGRHRYVRIGEPRVAELIERLAEHARPHQPRSLRASVRANRLAIARTCYDHLAGRLGVALRDGLVSRGLVDSKAGLHLTNRGERVFDELGIPRRSDTRRPPLRDCLDWTERREHLSGSLPAALLRRAVDQGWLRREPHRFVRILPEGREPFALLGLDIDSVVGGVVGSVVRAPEVSLS